MKKVQALVSYSRVEYEEEEVVLEDHTKVSQSYEDLKNDRIENSEEKETKIVRNHLDNEKLTNKNENKNKNLGEISLILDNGHEYDKDESTNRPNIDFSTWSNSKIESKYSKEIEKLIEWSKNGNSINRNLRESKEFKNPDILNGLIGILGIEQYGTNYPKSLWNTDHYKSSDFYDKLIQSQEDEFKIKNSSKTIGKKRTRIDFINNQNKSSAKKFGV